MGEQLGMFGEAQLEPVPTGSFLEQVVGACRQALKRGVPLGRGSMGVTCARGRWEAGGAVCGLGAWILSAKPEYDGRSLWGSVMRAGGLSGGYTLGFMSGWDGSGSAGDGLPGWEDGLRDGARAWREFHER